MKTSKSDFILKAIIREYLREQNPVGSLLLQESLNVPASTLRLYFKRLSDEGMLSKHHSSSGRTPTAAAMKTYWERYFIAKNLGTYHIDVLNDSAFFKLLDKYKLFCLSIMQHKQTLLDVINIKSKHLFLEFDNFALVLPYQAPCAALFNELLGCDEASILRVLKHLELDHIAHALSSELAKNLSFSHNLSNLLDMSFKYPSALVDELIERFFLDDLPQIGPLDDYLRDEFVSFCITANYAKWPVKLFICGSVYTDYEEFFTTLKEVA